MMNLKLSTENIRTIAMFEKITRVNPKDCIMTENSIYFLVDPGSMGMAIGRDGSNIKDLRKISEKHIKIFPKPATAEEFLKAIIPGIKSMDSDGGSMTVSVLQSDKLTVIGKNGDNINAIREFLKRHYKVSSLKLR